MTWKTIRRETGLIEHICLEHGCGHPNAGSIQYMQYINNQEAWEDAIDDDGMHYPEIPEEPLDSSWGIHGCCGCCGNKDFPGKAVGAINFALQRMKNERPEMIEALKKDYYILWWGLLAAMQEAQGLEEEY